MNATGGQASRLSLTSCPFGFSGLKVASPIRRIRLMAGTKDGDRRDTLITPERSAGLWPGSLTRRAWFAPGRRHRYLHKFWVATADPKHGLAASVPLPGSCVAKNHW